jgi:hypothetical protein
MSVTLTISDTTYRRLETLARIKGFETIEKFLDDWKPDENELGRRRELVERIDARREKIFQEHGLMPDSAELIREDRENR